MHDYVYVMVWTWMWSWCEVLVTVFMWHHLRHAYVLVLVWCSCDRDDLHVMTMWHTTEPNFYNIRCEGIYDSTKVFWWQCDMPIKCFCVQIKVHSSVFMMGWWWCWFLVHLVCNDVHISDGSYDIVHLIFIWCLYISWYGGHVFFPF